LFLSSRLLLLLLLLLLLTVCPWCARYVSSSFSSDCLSTVHPVLIAPLRIFLLLTCLSIVYPVLYPTEPHVMVAGAPAKKVGMATSRAPALAMEQELRTVPTPPTFCDDLEVGGLYSSVESSCPIP
jgi:hypothetical protein